MQPNALVLLDAVVETTRFPSFGKERHRHRLPEIVKLEPRGANGVENRGVVDGLRGDVELARAQEEVGVCGCSCAALASFDPLFSDVIGY